MQKSVCFNRIGMGNSDWFGFQSAQRSIEKALLLCGYKMVEVGGLALAHIGPHMFHRNPEQFNVLWPPYEASAIAPVLVEKINQADLVIASNEDNKQVFQEGGVDKPIEVCKLGIDTKLFHFADRSTQPKIPFRFLWVGQADIRKGWDIAVEAFQAAFKPTDPVQLYLKTTGKELQELAQIEQNVFTDSRNLALADLLDLYHESHVFVFPSRGEGTGLPALEAMATGLIVLAPMAFGLKDFVTEETAIPLLFQWKDANYGVPIQACEVDVKDLSVKMRQVYEQYEQYDVLRHKARTFVETYHSLQSLGERLSCILDEYYFAKEGADVIKESLV